MATSDAQRRPRPRLSRWRRPWIRSLVLGSAVVVLTLHAAAFGVTALLLPRGFALDDLHAWSDTWVPAATAIVLGAVLVPFVFLRSSALALSAATAGVAGAWLAAVGAGLLVFPHAFGLERAIGPLAIALALMTLAWATMMRRAATGGGLLAGAGLGVLAIVAQRAPPPGTRPAGGALAEVHGEPIKDEAASGQIAFPCGKEHVRLRPLLTFEGRPRRFDAFAKDKNGFRARYVDDGESTLVASKDAKGVDVEAVSVLPKDVDSQRNAFAAVYVPFPAWVTFSPTGNQRFAAGRAYLGADLRLHVVKAADGSLGLAQPHAEIASGPLRRDEPLTIEIGHADSSPGTCRLTFRDWTSQLATDPSPSAGWGVAENAILLGTNGKEATIVLTLADATLGPGWRSVAHAAGTYRNRVRIDTRMETPAEPPRAR